VILVPLTRLHGSRYNKPGNRHILRDSYYKSDLLARSVMRRRPVRRQLPKLAPGRRLLLSAAG
jgi:hypothetical protein